MWIALAIVLSVVLVTAMAMLFANHWLNKRQTLEERRVQIEEKKQETPVAPEAEPMPALLLMVAQGESELWAVEDSIKAFYEGRERLGTWHPITAKALNNAMRAERWDLNS